MSVTEVQGRISEIQSQLALLTSSRAGSATGAAFAATLAGARAGAVGGPAGTQPTSPAPTLTGREVVAAPGTTGLASGTPYAGLFTAAAAKYGVDANLLAAVARQESGFNAKAVSPAGARGLMQLMPGTARGLGVTDPLDPAQAVDGAARLLKGLLNEFGRTDLALAAYNAGPGAVQRYDGIPPYPETRNYVSSIMAMLGDRR